MLQKIIYTLFIINTLNTFSDGITLSDNYKTNLLLSMSAKLSDLRAQQEHQRHLIDGVIKRLDRQEKLLGELLKASDIHFHKVEDSNIKSLRADNAILKSDVENLKEDLESREGEWTTILRRMDGSVDFHRNWTEYKNGFGDLNGEFFLGLYKIHALTIEKRQELLIVLEDFEGNEKFETYDEFAIGNEDQQYILHTLGKANGTAGDSLSNHRGMQFSTFDRDNDHWPTNNCAQILSGGWWFNNCLHSNLNGKYNDNSLGKGVIWYESWGWSYSLKKAIMMIRSKN